MCPGASSDNQTMRLHIAIYVIVSVSALPFARSTSFPADVEWLKDLNDKETFSAARLSRAEEKQILEQVANTSFDSPDSWRSELRVRRLSLGQSEGLVIRAT